MNYTKSKREFDNNGYLVVNNFLSKNLSKKLKNKITDSEKSKNQKIYKYYTRSVKNRKLILNRIENLYINNKDVKKILSVKVSNFLKRLFKGLLKIFNLNINLY